MAAKINYKYYEGKDVYNDGDIEQDLINKFKKNRKYSPKEDKDLAYFYLLTPIRQNILNWYPFNENSNILEIGAGAGTITGMLCDKAKSVTVVEASKRRAELIYERHNNRNNLEIMVGNFNSIPFKKKYDYIVMIGVLEYGKIFSTGDNPYKTFLETIASHLNKNGKLLVAIENRNGLKYWCGASEDHLSLPYVGIMGYDNYKVKTFGKKELSDLLESSGFKYQRYYYPFPDYKLPYSIYTDEYIPSSFTVKHDLIFNHDDYGYFLDPTKAVDCILDNNLLGEFSNSFLVEASVDSEIKKIVDFAKLNTNRNEEYATITKICEDKVIKEAVSQKGKEHLLNIQKVHEKMEAIGINCVHVEIKNGKLEMNYYKYDTVTSLIEKYAKKAMKKEINCLIDNVFTYIEKNLTDIKKIDEVNNSIFNFSFYKNEVKFLKIGLIDLNFSNIFVNNNEFILFDQEWYTDELLSFDYAKYFSIKILYEQLPQMEQIIPRIEMFDKYEISSEMMNEFDKASEKYFFDINNIFDYKNYKTLLDRKTVNLKQEEQYKTIENLKTEKEHAIEELNKENEQNKLTIEALNDKIKKLEDSKNTRLTNIIKGIKRKIMFWK